MHPKNQNLNQNLNHDLDLDQNQETEPLLNQKQLKNKTSLNMTIITKIYLIKTKN